MRLPRGERLNDLAAYDVARHILTELGERPTLVPEHGRYRIEVNELVVRVGARGTPGRSWAPDEALRRGADVIVGVDYTAAPPEFHVAAVSAEVRPLGWGTDATRDRWEVITGAEVRAGT